MGTENDRLHFLHEEYVFALLKKRAKVSYKVNLSKNIVEELYTEEVPAEIIKNIITLEQIDSIAETFILDGDELARYRETSKRDYFINQFYAGITTLSLDYRTKSSKGKVVWVSRKCRLFKKHGSGELYCFCYIMNINARKKRELLYPEKIEYDVYSNLYKEKTARIMIDELLVRKRQNNSKIGGVFFTIALANYDYFKKTYGDFISHKILPELGDLIQLYMLPDSICTYGGNGRFYLYTNDYGNEDIIDHIEKLLMVLDTKYSFFEKDFQLNLFANIVFEEEEDNSFDKLNEKAKYIDRFANRETREKCVVYQNAALEYTDYSDKDDEFLKRLHDSDVKSMHMILNITAALIADEVLNVALNHVLKIMCQYYKAERTNLFEMDGIEGQGFNHIEWFDEGIESISEQISHSKVNVLQALQNVCKNGQIFMTQKIEGLMHKDEILYQSLKYLKIKSIYIAPFYVKNKLAGFLTVDNPSAHLGEAILLNAMAYFVPREINKRKILREKDFSKYYDALTELENRNSYQKYVNEMSGEHFSTMGVVIADINGLKEINKHFGGKYGDSLVQKLSNILRLQFANSNTYRYGGGTFVVIAADITQEKFEEKVRDFKKKFYNQNEMSIAVGHGWASMDIDIEKMVVHAEDMMLIAKQDYYQKAEETNKYYRFRLKQQVIEALKNNEFVIYLQPKAEIKSGIINGAEALIRRIHPIHGVMAPSKFVILLEKENLIRHIDIFVFEEVMKLLRKWIDAGKDVFTISLNFSRVTMLEPDIIHKMNKIQEKYKVPKGLVEIEITETLGDMEKSTIESIGEEIVKSGYRLSLDDFGASFSNLSILNTMRFDVLKLDKSIINNIVSADKSRIIIKKVLELCNELNIESIAEGVETVEQLNVLREMGCLQAQGYLFNKPIPVKKFEEKYIK